MTSFGRMFALTSVKKNIRLSYSNPHYCQKVMVNIFNTEITVKAQSYKKFKVLLLPFMALQVFSI